MAYDEKIADLVRERLSNMRRIDEKQMMGGLVFMVNDKMCVCVLQDELMCRISPKVRDEALTKKGTRLMEMGNRVSRGYILVERDGIRSLKDFEYWIGLCLDFNKDAKSPERSLSRPPGKRRPDAPVPICAKKVKPYAEGASTLLPGYCRVNCLFRLSSSVR